MTANDARSKFLLEYRDVAKTFELGKDVVSDFNLRIGHGETVVFIGPSGCGKTTTLRMTNRLEELSSGNILFGGVDTATIDPTKLRRSMGYVIQGIGLFPHMTIWENIATVPRLKGANRDELENIVDSCLELMELDYKEYAHKYPHELSGGQQQRVGVARALAGNPEVILMDEPFGALDPIVRESLQDELIRIKDQLSATIIFVTHDIHEAIKMGDRIVIMKDGRIVQIGDPLTLLANPANDFVRDFVGSKDVLAQFKYLKVADVDTHDRPPRIAESDSFAAARKKFDRRMRRYEYNGMGDIDKSPLVCVCSGEGKLLGCIDVSKPFSDDTPADQCMKIFPDITENSTAYEALSAMIANNVTNLPVQGEGGKPIGAISMTSLHDYLWRAR
ncbi:ATP-binding cassette domain-containing protein [Synergistaceae bacterium OttesenSCG-928-I11]|nr:ATP-binding cassette domain-containing protein [Synergistaceae bacterium OttesenSCG-928-I11]